MAAVFSGRASLPSVSEQYEWLAKFEENLQLAGGKDTKYHYLGGPEQWDYCRFLAKESGLITDTNSDTDTVAETGNADSSTAIVSVPGTTHSAFQHSRYLRMLQAIYDDNMKHRVLYPGAPDTYRERVYTVDR